MKRWISLLLVCMLSSFLLPLAALAERELFEFSAPVFPGRQGREESISWHRTRKDRSSGTLIIKDENGAVLGQGRIGSNVLYGVIRVTLTADMPFAQTIGLYFEQNGQQTLQDTCILAADDNQSDGLRKVDTAEKKIAITFDSANGRGQLPALLDALDALDAKCTFFLQGEFFRSNSEWAQELHARGHELANHSMSHPNMPELDNIRIYKEIANCNALIEAITGEGGTLYRPPSGYYTYRDKAIGRALGSESILWTFDSKDGFTEYSRSDIMNNMTKNSEPGAIILMHIYGKHTITVLKEYIPMMQAQGYEFVTVSDLMIPGGTIDKAGVMHAPAE